MKLFIIALTFTAFLSNISYACPTSKELKELSFKKASNFSDLRGLIDILENNYKKAIAEIPSPTPKELEWLEKEDKASAIRRFKSTESDIYWRREVLYNYETNIEYLQELKRAPDNSLYWLGIIDLSLFGNHINHVSNLAYHKIVPLSAFGYGGLFDNTVERACMDVTRVITHFALIPIAQNYTIR